MTTLISSSRESIRAVRESGRASAARTILDRVRAMSLAEIACRGRQQAYKFLERVGPAKGHWPIPGPMLSREAPALADPAAGRDRLIGATANRFFVGATESRVVPVLNDQFPQARQGITESADRICAGRFDLLGYRGLDFGDPVNWHFDPVAGRRAPAVHWSLLDPLDAAKIGDSKVIWELNRHQSLVTLAQAYRLSGCPRRLEVVGELFDSWLVDNPPGIGINWTSSLELGVRLIAWCWTFALLRRTAWLSADRCARLLVAVHAHATHVERYLSYYFSPNTHLTGEALGLLYAGVMFPEFRDAARWRSLGRRILIEQSRRQIADDGVYIEQATCYQRYTIEIYLHFLILAERNGLSVPVDVRDRVSRLLEFLLSISQPAGTMPDIGDADSGWLLPLTPRSRHDCRGVFGLAAAFFGRSDFAWAAGASCPEVLWMLGTGGLARFNRLAATPPKTPASRAFSSSGYAVMRSGWEPTARRLLVDVGPLGGDVTGAHGHADLLSIQCSAHGEEYLSDPGTFGYADRSWRDHFRGTAAHSTVVIDGLNQAQPAGTFAWRSRPRARLREWRSTAELDFLDADHDAYASPSDPARHRRRVLFVKPRYWVVVDDLIGAADHRVDVRFQFADRRVSLGSDLWACAPGSADGGLWLKSFSNVPLSGMVHQGREHPIEGWVSPGYGERRPAPVVVYSAVGRFPLRIVTLVMPVDRLSALPPVVRMVAGGSGPIAGLTLVDEGETIRVDDRTISIDLHAAALSS